MRNVAKSGWPVRGQTQVNSGQTSSTSYWTSGCGLGTVSSSRDGRVGMKLPGIARIATAVRSTNPAQPSPIVLTHDKRTFPVYNGRRKGRLRWDHYHRD